MGILRERMQPNPYAPPQAPSFQPPPQGPVPGPNDYQSPTRTGTQALIAMGALTALGILFRIVDVGMVLIPAMTSFSVGVGKLLNPISGWIRLGAAVGFLFWIHRVATNVRALGKSGLNSSPRMCVWWFFIPIASLFMPCVVVVQISSATSANARASLLIPLWWLAYLFSVFANAGRRLMGTVQTHDDLAAVVAVDCVATFFTTIAFFLIFFVIRQIDRDQEHAFADTSRR